MSKAYRYLVIWTTDGDMHHILDTGQFLCLDPALELVSGFSGYNDKKIEFVRITSPQFLFFEGRFLL